MISLDYILFISSLVGIYGLIAMALNVQVGHGGLINFGLVAYVGLGGYAYALLTGTAGLPWIVGLIAAVLVGILTGYLSVAAFLELRREYLAIVALSLGELLRYFYTNESSLTGGVTGIVGLNRPLYNASISVGTSYEITWGIISLVSLVVAFLAINLIIKSPFGRLLRAISSDEKICESVGRDVNSIRRKTWVLGSAIFSLAGAFLAIYYNSVFPGFFGTHLTFFIWTIMIVGGLGSSLGVVLATVLIVPFEELTNYLMAATGMLQLAALRGVFYGLLIVLVLRFRPQGMLGKKRVD
jgi:ABC-type branched-subunit amino acid transport system permease subunit